MTDEVTHPSFSTVLRVVPPHERESLEEAVDHMADATRIAKGRREAKRDAVCAVALAIVRRGDHPVTGWSVKDHQTAEAIGELLIGLETKE
jgi:hypothetical protein